MGFASLNPILQADGEALRWVPKALKSRINCSSATSHRKTPIRA